MTNTKHTNTTETTVSAERFVTKRKNRGHVSYLLKCIERDSDVADFDFDSRFMQEFGGEVVEIYKVRVWTELCQEDGSLYGDKDITEHHCQWGYEVTFKNGSKGYVQPFGGGHQPELLAVIEADRTGHLGGTWKKYGQTRGHAVSWFTAQKGKRGRQPRNKPCAWPADLACAVLGITREEYYRRCRARDEAAKAAQAAPVDAHTNMLEMLGAC